VTGDDDAARRVLADEVLAHQVNSEAPTTGGSGSGRPLTEIGSAVYRVEGGRIAEYWIQLDRLGMLEQRAQQ
jgi:hypothetical protein